MKIIDLSEGFIEVELGLANGKEYYSQGILFRDETDIGVIIPTIKEIEEGLKTITIKSPLYPREFEFSVSKDFVAIENDYLMFLPIEELECSKEIKHRTKVYSKEELKTLRYVMEVHFHGPYYDGEDCFCYSERVYTYFFGKSKEILRTNQINYLSEIPSIIDTPKDDSFIYVSILDAELYNGSPVVARYYNNGKEVNNINGIFIKNPVSMPELKKLSNTGIVIFNDIIKDLIRKL